MSSSFPSSNALLSKFCASENTKIAVIVALCVLGCTTIGFLAWALVEQFSNSVSGKDHNLLYVGNLGQQSMFLEYNPISKSVNTYGAGFVVKGAPTANWSSDQFSVIIPGLLPAVDSTFAFTRGGPGSNKLKVVISRPGVNPVSVQLEPLGLSNLGLYLKQISKT